MSRYVEVVKVGGPKRKSIPLGIVLDLCEAVVGFASLAIGCWWVYPPASLIVCGALLLAGTFVTVGKRVKHGIDKRSTRIQVD